MPLKKYWNDELPDPSLWLPRPAQSVQNIFMKRCKGIEQKILLRAQLEREMNIDNYDSGLGVEDIIREELRDLCPSRYSIRAGTIDDCIGHTAGDFEVIITNDYWFTHLKTGATKESRKVHFPI